MDEGPGASRVFCCPPAVRGGGTTTDFSNRARLPLHPDACFRPGIRLGVAFQGGINVQVEICRSVAGWWIGHGGNRRRFSAGCDADAIFSASENRAERATCAGWVHAASAIGAKLVLRRLHGTFALWHQRMAVLPVQLRRREAHLPEGRKLLTHRNDKGAHGRPCCGSGRGRYSGFRPFSVTTFL